MSLLSDIAIAIKTKLGGTSTNNTIPRYDGTTCTLKNSNVTISDTNVVTAEGGFVGNLTGTASNATLATSATKLETARTINGVPFNGTSNITIADSTKAPLTGGGTSGTWGISITGNASTANNASLAANATKLATERFINGVAFDGTADITVADSTKVPLNGAGATGTWGISITGNSASTTKLATARTISLSGAATGTATSFDGTGNISIPVTGLNASNLNSGTVPDARLSGVYSGMSLKLNGNNTVFSTESSGSTNISRTVYGLAEYKNNNKATTGAIVFIAPSNSNDVMHQLEVSGLLYEQNIVSLIVQGYKYNGVWADLRKISTGTADIQVRWGATPAGNNCLILGDVGTVWSYPHMTITRAMFGHTGVTDAYCTGWTVALVTSFTGYTNITANIGDSTMIGNVSSATRLQTARTIGGVSFDGTANINLPGVNATGNQSTTGNSATATKLATARTINGVSFDGTANITIADSTKAPLTGAGASGTWGISISGNADTATKLQTARTIGGVSFDGSANINLPGVNVTGNQSTTGNAATATQLATARTINGVSFNGTANITIYDSTKAPLASPALTGTPTAPTAAADTNNTQIATTAFVKSLIGTGTFTQSLAANGYQKLSSGWIIQWGTRANGGIGFFAVTFPIAFPSVCVNVQTTYFRDGQNGDYRGVSSVTNTGAYIATDNGQTFWMAIGY